MQEITFQTIKRENKEEIKQYLSMVSYQNCELTFANLFLWSHYYQLEYAVFEEMLVFRRAMEPSCFYYPIGKNKEKQVLEILQQDCREKGLPFSLYGVNEEMFAALDTFFPNSFQITYHRDEADYIYLVEDLKKLQGKRYHGKRNHINQFKQKNEWSYEPITPGTIQECKEMVRNWAKATSQEEVQQQKSRLEETKISLQALEEMEFLELQGGLIRVGGEVVACTLGEAVTEDTFNIHIEKAYPWVQGAYPMIHQQFLEHLDEKYIYVNREEDMGVEGLRKAKLSYHPVKLLQKGIVTRKNEKEMGTKVETAYVK